jgi:diamine N-acetyltransferase
MHTKIIEADVSHTAIIATIGKKSFRNAFERLFKSKEELFEYLEYTYDPMKLAKSMRKANNVYLLAFLDGAPVGFVKIKKHSLNDQIEGGAQVELQKIYVLPEHHGKGIGTALLNEVKSLVREMYPDYLWLDTPINNEKAIRLYEKNGFRKMGSYYFTIGTQSFEYYVMGLPVAFKITSAC